MFGLQPDKKLAPVPKVMQSLDPSMLVDRENLLADTQGSFSLDEHHIDFKNKKEKTSMHRLMNSI
jgi:hypothetical protein